MSARDNIRSAVLRAAAGGREVVIGATVACVRLAARLAEQDCGALGVRYTHNEAIGRIQIDDAGSLLFLVKSGPVERDERLKGFAPDTTFTMLESYNELDEPLRARTVDYATITKALSA